MRLSVDDHRSTAERVNQPEVHTERFLGPMIKVPYRSRHQFNIRQTHHGHFTIAHRRRRLWSRGSRGPRSLFRCPTVRWLQLQRTTAFGSYLECLPWTLVGPRMEDGRYREPVFRQPLPRQRPEGGCM